MSDQRIQYSEEMVGAGHPTKDDTLNRLALVEADSSGRGKYRYLLQQSAPPATGEAQGVLYSGEMDGAPELFYRGRNNGDPVRLTDGAGLAAPLVLRGVSLAKASDTTLTIAAGARIPIGGAVCKTAGGLTLTLATMLGESPAASTWYTILANRPAGGAALAAGDFSATAGAVERDGALAYHAASGQATGQRAVGVVRTDAAGAIGDFEQQGGLWMPVDSQSLPALSTSAPATTATLLTLPLPLFTGRRWPVLLCGYVSAFNAPLYIGNGDAAAINNSAGMAARPDGSTVQAVPLRAQLSNASAQIQYMCGTASGHVYLFVAGLELPPDMRSL